MEHQIRDHRIRDERVLAAMREVPRHLFVPKGYERPPMRTGRPHREGQTIPALHRRRHDLQLGLHRRTGCSRRERSGYQAALLAGSGRSYRSNAEGVAEQARENLARAGVTGVRIVVGDGTEGYPPEAPYDAIIVTAASPGVPEPLIEQLAEGGRLIAPIGPRDCQDLVKLVKREGKVETIPLGGVCFVPLIGQFGWRGEGFR